jgi:spectrin beta
MTITEDVEEIEILKARFDTLDQEMKSNSDKVDTVNELATQLLQNEHPNSDEVISREKELNNKWSELRDLADEKKNSLTLAHSVNTWHIECQETMVSCWIFRKRFVMREVYFKIVRDVQMLLYF